MIQVRSESALSLGYKAGGWSHMNEVYCSPCRTLDHAYLEMQSRQNGIMGSTLIDTKLLLKTNLEFDVTV